MAKIFHNTVNEKLKHMLGVGCTKASFGLLMYILRYKYPHNGYKSQRNKSQHARSIDIFHRKKQCGKTM